MTKQFVCNGAKGADGETGFTDTLPGGKTETGSWSSPSLSENPSEVLMPISFAIPLAADIAGSNVHFLPLGGSDANCTGTAASPAAAPGHLCVYTAVAIEVIEAENKTINAVIQKSGAPYSGGFASGASQTGAVLNMNVPAFTIANGTWAVTAPTS